MHADAACDLPALYHQTEEHFFAATCVMHRRYGAGINAYFTDEPSNPWNLLLIRVGSAQSGDAMAAPLDLICNTSTDIRAVIHEEQVEALCEVLAGLGFQAAEKTTAMVFDLSRLVPSTGDGQLQISLTRNMNEWAVPLGSAFSIPPEIVANYQARHQRALDAGQRLYHFTLSAEGQVRGSLTLSMSEGDAWLSDVGTIASFRGRGYGTRLIHAALLHASGLGAQRCFLEASTDALSLYRKLGFERLFDYTSFVRRRVEGP